MGRQPTKAAENPWCQARIRAASYDRRLSSREGAAELLGMSVSAVSDAELGLSKCMPVDKAVLMSDLYNAPELLNYYCIHECPIGPSLAISDSSYDLDRITVKLLKGLKTEDLDKLKGTLIDIAEDGIISENEVENFKEISEYLEKLSETISEMLILSKKVLNGGENHGRKKGAGKDS